ncbi:MAG: 30S ribosomal protein S18 [Armatimonadetes bacterium CG2_30_59_28]|nr:30S ribosomal protein S18 [Armatimonadota bacterium]OIO98526.1 MAG: 30S ribosomal protein S18 [Armatimonadetes bacterium CG2_30_59_28]PJB61776.1 MAG: 30S ribosomal protein S18 [Armatimonadetes bacterium CG_4_9_14_3_um_filter_58_7]
MSNGYRNRSRTRPPGRFRRPRRRVCTFCADREATIDYKNAGRLRRYVSDRGKILPRRQSGNCAKHQREIARAVKRARELDLLVYIAE